ncbi:MAG: hypothetical protein KC516_00585 [Nanoarchaeota archaeon]|nr:hypothetical protein [Nanoarchaeota archaeon]
MEEGSNVSYLRRKQVEFERAQQTKELESLDVQPKKDTSWIMKSIIVFLIVAGLTFLLFLFGLI